MNSTIFNGACHCGAVRFKVDLPHALDAVHRCDCSYCTMRGAVVLTALVGDLEIVEGQSSLTLYRFNTDTAKHYFCSVCGIYTHHQRRSDPRELAVNVACLEWVSPFDFERVPVSDGRRHPSDQADGRSRVAGVLHYVRNAVGDDDLDGLS